MFSYLPFPIQKAAGRAGDGRLDPADHHRRELARVLRAEVRERRAAGLASLARLAAALSSLPRAWRRPAAPSLGA